MGELEDKLNSILSSPEEMEKLMGIARSLSGSLGSSEAASDPESKSDDQFDLSSLTSVIGNMDPKTFGLISKLLSEYTSGGDDKAALLSAMKPYVKKDRHEQIDKAVQLARLARLAKVAFSDFSGGDLGV